jgi:hypothetical protein
LDSDDSGPQRSPTFQLLRLADPVIHGPRRPQQDYRHHRQAELRKQLAELNAQMRATPVGSPERDALLIPMEPLLNAVLALADELHC